MQKWWRILAGVLCAGTILAQEPPTFTSVQVLTNREVRLQLAGTNGVNYRLDVAEDIPSWEPLTSFSGQGLIVRTDSGAPYRSNRYYRAVQIGTNGLTGDHIATADGEVIIRPVNHASFVMSWNGLTIYNDPVGGAARFRDFPPADLILVSHSHGDHFDANTLNAVRASSGMIVAPQAVFNSLSALLRSNTIVLANGDATNILGLEIEAVPAYNANHPRGAGNGYVATIGGKRFYMSGDTGDTPEMRALQNIDVAFVCMNVPFTMPVNIAAGVVRDFKPRILYPYHYRNQDGTFADLDALKRIVGTEDGIEIRTRAWY